METNVGLRPEALSATQQLLLAFLASGEGQELDPVRIQKGMFVFGQEAPGEWGIGSRYEFVPYNYGPYSFALADDLARLRERGLVRTRAVPGRSWEYYSLTPRGESAARMVLEHLDARAAEYLDSVRRFVDQRSFRQLLAAVYERYPKYATNSIFRF